MMHSPNAYMRLVYPRECGATEYINSAATPGAGLSPRVRGNLFRKYFVSPFIGSIPASAGQPGTSRATT